MINWYTITVISGFCVLAPAIAGWYRLSQIQPVFYPFILLLTMDVIAEGISYLLIHANGNNIAWYNIYALVSWLLIAWQLKKWAPSRKYGAILVLTVAWLVVLWLMCRYCIHRSNNYFSIFLFMKDGCIAAFSFYLLYHRIPCNAFSLHHDAVLLICAGWLILFVYDGITELLIFCSQWLDTPALPYLESFFAIVNLLVLIIHLIAVIWIPPQLHS